MNDKLKVLPPRGHAPSNKDVAAALRRLADSAEAADAADIANCVVLLEHHDGYLQRISCGLPIDRTRLVGLLEMAKLREVVK